MIESGVVMNTRFWILGVTLGLGLACAGGGETVDVGDDAAVPLPSPEPPDPVKSKRPGRDRDRDPQRRNPNGGPDRGDDDDDDRPARKACTLVDIRASSSSDGHAESNVGDDDPKTSWCENAGGSGVGQELIWSRSEGCSFDEIELLNGNFKDATTFGQFGRLKRIRIFDPEEPAEAKTFEFEDRSFQKALDQPEILELPEDMRSAKTLTLRIDAVYGGSKNQSTCVSSVKLK